MKKQDKSLKEKLDEEDTSNYAWKGIQSNDSKSCSKIIDQENIRNV